MVKGRLPKSLYEYPGDQRTTKEYYGKEKE